jgi:hypothetical protein
VTNGERRKAMIAFVEETQRYDWDHLLAAARNAIKSPMSIEVEGTLERIRESIRLVGPVDWEAVPWPVYLGGLYRQVIGPQHYGSLATPGEILETTERMQAYTNPRDLEICIELTNILKRREAIQP